MKLPAEFIRLPLDFDAARLQAEVDAIEEDAWRPHPQGFRGNSALLLVAADGDPANDAIRGLMQPTPLLARLPYLRQVLAAFRSRLGRTRLMRIDEHEEVEPHCDQHYYWREHLRVHVPIRTDSAVRFYCGERDLHMAEGECWVFDTWRRHRVTNASGKRRIHLVADMRGSPWLWQRIEAGLAGCEPVAHTGFDPHAEAALTSEGPSMPVVMSPLELADHIEALLHDLHSAPAIPADGKLRIEQALARLRLRWQAVWVEHAASQEGWPHFRALLDEVRRALKSVPPDWRFVNGVAVREALSHWILDAALNPELASRDLLRPFARRQPALAPHFAAPVFLVAAPRSGSSLLFETLSRNEQAWTIGGESHSVIEGIAALAPAAHDWASNRLDADDATPDVVAELQRRFAARLRDRDGHPWQEEHGPVCLLEKTPKNALRIPFLAQAFPDARFVYLVREPRANVSSILEAWRSGNFVTYEKLPGWKGGRWSLLLIPGWRELEGVGLADVALAQYDAAHTAIQRDLAALPRERWHALDYDALVAQPRDQIERLSAWLGFEWDRPPPQALPPSIVTVTRPARDKWQRNADVLAPLSPALDRWHARLEQFTGLTLARATSRSKTPAPQPAAASRATPATDVAALPERPPAAPHLAPAAAAKARPPSAAVQRALASVHTRSFAEVLRRAGVSLAVSTYQAGKLVLVRATDAGVDTGFKELRKPMGIALSGNRLAIGCGGEVRQFQRMPSLAPKLAPAGTVDMAWVPRASHVTGNIDIHELAYAGDTLWAVNTRFCCLCTFAPDASFVPHWKPSFLSALAPEDRCHLNGLAVRDGQVRYVTLLGRSDAPGGWRERKADGGELIDLRGEQVICSGLSMPHSPRWYRNQLWVLESGTGGLCRVDPHSGARETVVELPGFTRGLDFHGPLAFVGLSQVRESAVFAKLPLTERLSERICGVWIVNVEQARIVGFLRFEDAVQEIFAVTVLPAQRHPELLLPDDPALADAFILPTEALPQVPPERRSVQA
jgi:uncharacterized protein (TIGR03032 family)